MTECDTRHDESEGFHRQGSVSSQQDLVQWENASVETCTVISLLGYGLEIIHVRRDAYREHCRLRTARANGTITTIITGSKAGGGELTRFLESDIDIMFVRNNFVCLEDCVSADKFPREITVFRSYSRMSYPGHCRLLLERRGTTTDWNVTDALCDDGHGHELLSSDLFLHNCRKCKFMKGIVQHDRSGPSMPNTLSVTLHTDIVDAFLYHCPSILSKWAARPRHWPLPDVVQQVVSLGAFLTPVGFKGSEYQHVEWRVCFNAGEIELVNNLTETHIKLYFLLKRVKNDVLNPHKKEVSSYTLKNIVLWIAENNHQSLFHERNLLHWLHVALDALRVALDTRELPNYMIPDRNLMAASELDGEQQSSWISTITEMINEGPRMILRLPKIRQALIAHPEPFRWYIRRILELELLMLMNNNRMILCGDESGKVDETDAILQALFRVQEVCLRMRMGGSRVINADAISDRIMM
ncbi:uncharacterized protein LOC127870285 [Dreissena polymorpha]|uniref:uncharacterized protein LOC127870285 n=1 Tax=Dreissena polymorpha TaxID=45954 RepID=UPI002263FD8A|nr:uncharacterized protein LOC127870285 [Dreissena polymorpha]